MPLGEVFRPSFDGQQALVKRPTDHSTTRLRPAPFGEVSWPSHSGTVDLGRPCILDERDPATRVAIISSRVAGGASNVVLQPNSRGIPKRPGAAVVAAASRRRTCGRRSPRLRRDAAATETSRPARAREATGPGNRRQIPATSRDHELDRAPDN